MKELISREFYKLCHSKRLGMTLVFLLLMTWFMYFYSSEGKNRLVYVLLDQTEEEAEFWNQDGWLDQDIIDLVGRGSCDHTAGEGRYFWMTPEAMELFREGGALCEKYRQYRFPERMVLQQLLGSELAPPEQEDFESFWRFRKILRDTSASDYTAWIFPVIFFGMDFTARGYQGALFAGQKKRKLFWGKYLVFTLVFFLLSLVELLLAMRIFIPKISLLPLPYLIKGLTVRCMLDTGKALLLVPFVFLGKTEWKALGLSFLVKLLFFSNVAVINLDPYAFISREYWESCSHLGTMLLTGAVTVAAFVVSGVLSSGLFQRTELK